MRTKRPLILVSNDDGVEAKGINELIGYLRPLGDVLVMAPDSPRSGMGCAITADRPIKYTLVSQEPGLTIYKCSGTPTDCIKLAIFDLLESAPDVVIGGINHGDNSAVNVHYSGTMGVVIEGCLKGIPSIGYSLCNHAADADFAPTARYIQEITRLVLEKGLPKGICLNVNFPSSETFNGVRICQQAQGVWQKEWEKRKHPHHGEYFWLTGNFEPSEQGNEQSDQWALAHDYVAITPTQVDVTAYGFIEELEMWNIE